MMPRGNGVYVVWLSSSSRLLEQLRLLPFAPTRLWTPSSSVDRTGCAIGIDQVGLNSDVRVRLEDLAHVKSAGPRI